MSPLDTGARSFGYCVRCGLYGAGVFDHVVSPYSDAIRDHVGCREGEPSLPRARVRADAARHMGNVD